MTRVQANLLLLLTGAIWGAGFVAQSTAMQAIGPIWFIAIRFAIATMVAAPLAFFETRRIGTAVTFREIRGFLWVGLALFGGALTQQIGLLTTSVTNSGFLTGLYVVFVPILTVVFLRKQPHWIIWPTALMATFGIFLLSGGTLGTLSTGDMLTILCAFFWALQILLAGIFVAGGRPMFLSMTQFAVCSVAGAVLASMFETVTLSAIVEALPEILYSGLFSSGIAFILQIVGQRYTSAPQAAIFLSSEALFAALFGVLLLGETIAPIGYVGCAVIFAAMLLVELVPEFGKSRKKAGAPV